MRRHVRTANPFAGFFGRPKAEPPRPFRRLRGERLEGRMVLSTAPVPADAPQSQSLDEYLDQEHAMGPIAPAEVAAIDDAVAVADSQPVVTAASPAAADHLFSSGYGEGEGEGSGSGSSVGSGSGSGSGSGAGSGSGSGAGSGSGSGNGTSSGSGSGSGTGSGSGSGSSAGSGSSDPTISDPTVTNEDGTVIVTGTISDNGGMEGIDVTIDGADGTVTVNEDGTFTVNVTTPEGNGTFTITVVDADGNSTVYTVGY